VVGALAWFLARHLEDIRTTKKFIDWTKNVDKYHMTE
jgi:hypothetical protein